MRPLSVDRACPKTPKISSSELISLLYSDLEPIYVYYMRILAILMLNFDVNIGLILINFVKIFTVNFSLFSSNIHQDKYLHVLFKYCSSSFKIRSRFVQHQVTIFHISSTSFNIK